MRWGEREPAGLRSGGCSGGVVPPPLPLASTNQNFLLPFIRCTTPGCARPSRPTPPGPPSPRCGGSWGGRHAPRGSRRPGRVRCSACLRPGPACNPVPMMLLSCLLSSRPQVYINGEFVGGADIVEQVGPARRLCVAAAAAARHCRPWPGLAAPRRWLSRFGDRLPPTPPGPVHQSPRRRRRCTTAASSRRSCKRPGQRRRLEPPGLPEADL